MLYFLGLRMFLWSLDLNATWLNKIFLHHTLFCSAPRRHFSVAIWQHGLLVGTREANLTLPLKKAILFLLFPFSFQKEIHVPEECSFLPAFPGTRCALLSCSSVLHPHKDVSCFSMGTVFSLHLLCSLLQILYLFLCFSVFIFCDYCLLFLMLTYFSFARIISKHPCLLFFSHVYSVSCYF